MNLTDITKQIRAFADQLEEQNKPDPYAELKAAHAAGKVIQLLDNILWGDCLQTPDWSAPVHDYRIKSDAPPFQLPPPPPGMQWHRTDGWKAEDLPPGTRPHVLDEEDYPEDSERRADGWRSCTRQKYGTTDEDFHRRTTRPLVFEHEGKSWTYHRPGDPMPCDGEAWVTLLLRSAGAGKTSAANNCYWDTSPSLGSQIIGWRYAEPLTREVELGPCDVPPGSILKANSWAAHEWRSVDHVYSDGVLLSNCPITHRWAELMRDYKINRPRHRDADGNPTLWEKCSKEVPA